MMHLLEGFVDDIIPQGKVPVALVKELRMSAIERRLSLRMHPKRKRLYLN